ncbi:hypothetical protein CRE_12502 [Caenorhabditis remanei]|uniref:Uncharacterized protein n=2 Tax=Caenorhabditis remanei TaxID=31234 RepID=E3M7A3_CAERE|nr:hypothetical protein CRE_12502 [Caenorhabditis remanei]
MLAVHDKDSKFLLEVLSSLESSLDEVISPPFFIMSDQLDRQNSINYVVGLLRQALLDSRVGWVVRMMFGPRERALTAEEIISLNSRAFPLNAKLPDNFLEKFKGLPRVPMETMLRMLGWKDIHNLQLVAGPFADCIAAGRRNFPMHELVQGAALLVGTEKVIVYRYNGKVEVNHDQFARSLRTVRVKNLTLKQEGTLRAVSYHIPELSCNTLNLRISDAVDPVEEEELAQVVEQIIVNPHITELSLIARKIGDTRALMNRLDAIKARGQHLNQAKSTIVVISP